MPLHDCQSKYCIIGAGASGLAAAKTFVERGIPFDCLEREQDIGGLWNIATPSGVVYETTHLVSCISSTGFDDMPMLDEDYPEYPGHARVLGYFRDLAAKYGLMEHIELGKVITEVAPRADGRWDVVVAGEAEPRVYRGVVIASGHHDTPRMPVYPGTFAGEILHSRAYKSPRQLRDQRVLVVGCGNSAADIVSDAVHGGSEVFLSIRRGYWFVPKFILGFPTGDILSYGEMAPLPRRVKSWIFQAVLWLVQGPPSRYRMPDPDYRIDQAHPTMTDEIPRLVAHGDLIIKPEIARYDGKRVLFKDGSDEVVDTIVFATGYQPIIPYIDEGLIFARDGYPRFLVNVVHPEQENLFAVGLTQANGSMWRTADYQSQLVANLIVAGKHAPDEVRTFRQWLADYVAKAGRRAYVASDRHRLEVNYYDYRRLMKRLNRRFGAVRGMKLEANAKVAALARRGR
ncbi:MAG TPA: NAD(P)-binding domain-containing protein [Hyphomicrobiaceae bacterium]|nr:NAD(P)-binding domain-containing protein [Hyphomicrobiaceae bacterium]